VAKRSDSQTPDPILPSDAQTPDPIRPSEEIAPSSHSDDDFVRGVSTESVRQTNAYSSQVWLLAPARLFLLAEAAKALVKVASLRGLPDQEITKVEVYLQKSTTRLFLFPAKGTALDAFPVTYGPGRISAEVNIRPLLQPHNLEAPQGYKLLYDVWVDPDSPFGPALVVELKTHKQRATHRRQKGDPMASSKRSASKASKVTPQDDDFDDDLDFDEDDDD
jgi:hypothetical protein